MFHIPFRTLAIFILSIILLSCSTESTPVYQLTVNVEPAEAGAVIQSALEAEEGESIEVTADPNEHWIFRGWGGDLTGNQNPASVLMDRDKSVTALFEKRDYPLTITIEGEGTVDQEVVTAKTTDYPYETVVQLTPIASDGWSFAEWGGDVSSAEEVIEVSIDGETNITAIFERDFFDVTVSTEGDGEVDINVESGREEDGRYEFESVLTLTAVPKEGWKFESWKKDDVISTDESLTVVIEQDVMLTAVFQDQRSVYSVNLGLSDGRDTIELYFGQDGNPSEKDEQAPPAPPAGAMHGFFDRDGKQWWSDFRDKIENKAEWQLYFQGSDSETLTLSWDIEVSKKIGTLILRDSNGELEIDMSAVDNVMLDEHIQSPLSIEYEIID